MTPFDMDTSDRDFREHPEFFVRPAATITIETTEGEHIQTIEIPEQRIPRSELPAEWLRLEQEEQHQ
jgi:hypothetical protein